MIKGLTINDEIFYVEISNNEISDIRYLKFINMKECLTAKFINYSPFKYFFHVEKEELVDIEYINTKEFCDKFKSYDIEVIKYKRENDDYWKDYERTKRDYNWKYEIANGKNKNWVMMKKKFLDDFLNEIKDVQKKQKDNVDKSETLKVLNRNLDDMLELISPVMSCHGEFIKPGASGMMNISLHRSTAFFDTLIKEYNKLMMKYKQRTDHPVYAVLMDFNKLIKDNTNLNFLEKQSITYVMENGFSYDGVVSMLNSNFTRKNKPFDYIYAKQLFDYIIPNKIFKQYDLACRRRVS